MVWRLAERGTSVVLASRDPRFLERLGDREVNVVVSSAAIALDGFDDVVVARTLATNDVGATKIVDALTPRFVRGSRVVMVSSGVGELAGLAPSIRGSSGGGAKPCGSALSGGE